ncbi:tetratricopeptide repeat protein [Nonomuraea sp. LP-02]|uniref:tetratricopeptide repeat protein n=1 Tax=Nonomuraea sp. LP-02 TaxID=3097960 RepID=UPI002E307538|nr:tetratricopeptide repeat protein [Nonomuraea sp. LP-02]MED7928040.1 tetratricopeptide repeat protein [Nonomuraea sp. LP-02]
MLAWTAAAATLLVGVAGFFLGFLLNLPRDLLDVFDKRSSVISMVLSLLFGMLGVWLQRRPLPTTASLPPAPIALLPRPLCLAGREETLAALHTRLADAQTLPSWIAVHGLGGIGKTSLLAEYSHRYLHAYRLVWHLAAEEPTLLSAAFADLATQLGVHQGDGADPVHQVHAVLDTYPGRWLLIFDNAPDADSIQAFLPPTGSGHVLLTSRSGSWPDSHGLELTVLEREPATAFLLQRSGHDDAQSAAAVVAELGGLPLALEQAGAYMAETGTTPSGYLALLTSDRTALLAVGTPWGYAEKVASTWQAAFDHLATTSPPAIALLRLLACYAPENIPYQLLLDDLTVESLVELGIGKGAKKQLSLLPTGRMQVNAALIALRRYCLISRPHDGLVSVHRLVQSVTLDRLTAGQRTAWSAAASRALQQALPGTPWASEARSDYRRLLAHALTLLPPGSGGLLEISRYLGAAGDYRTARALAQQLYGHHTEHLGADHPDTLAAWHYLARWTGDAGNAASARDQLAALLPIRQRVLGSEHPNTLATRHHLAYWTGEAGDAATARDQLAALLPIRQRVLGSEHPHTLTTQYSLARWTGEAGDATAARDAFAALLPIRQRVLGLEHPDASLIRHGLARWTGEAGGAAAARDQYAALLPIHHRVLGAEHPHTLIIQHNLARWTGEAGDAATARDAFAALLPVRQRVLGAEHPNTLLTQRSLIYWTSRARSVSRLSRGGPR